MRLAVLLFFSCSFTNAIPQENYRENYEKTITPFLKTSKVKRFLGKKGKKIVYAVFENQGSKGPIVIAPGRIESYLHYGELAYDLVQKGYGPVYIIEQRGQALSEKIAKDAYRGDIDRFEYMVDDFTNFYSLVIKDLKKKGIAQKLNLIAHSMGGGVVAGALIRKELDVKKIVMIAPMFGFPTPLGETITYWALKTLCLSEAFCKKISRKPYKKKPFRANNVSTSHEGRWWVQRYRVLKNHPQIKQWPATYRWVIEAIDLNRYNLANAGKIKTPILLFQAGLDQLVDNPRQNEFCKKAQNCKLVHISNSQHQIQLERDEIRNIFLKQIFTFL